MYVSNISDRWFKDIESIHNFFMHLIYAHMSHIWAVAAFKPDGFIVRDEQTSDNPTIHAVESITNHPPNHHK